MLSAIFFQIKARGQQIFPDFQRFCEGFNRFYPDFHRFSSDFCQIKTFGGVCTPCTPSSYTTVWSVVIKRPELPINDEARMMHILKAQVCGYISAHPGLPQQKTKRESSDASKSELNQASWNETVLKFDSENLMDDHNYFSILLWFFLDRTIWKESRQFDWVSATHLSIGTCYRGTWELLAFEIRKN